MPVVVSKLPFKVKPCVVVKLDIFTGEPLTEGPFSVSAFVKLTASTKVWEASVLRSIVAPDVAASVLA